MIQEPQTQTELQRALTSLRPSLRSAAIFSFISALLLLVPSLYMLEVYDRVVNTRNLTTLGMLTALVLLAYVTMEILDWARREILADAGSQLEALLRDRIFNAIFRARMQGAEGGSPQPMLDLRTLRDFFPSPPVTAIMESPVSLVFLVFIFSMHPILGWSATIGAVVQVLVAWLNEKSTRKPLTEANSAAVAAQRYADGTLRNAQVIESMGMLKNIHERWMLRQRSVLELQAKASIRAGAFSAIAKFWQLVVGSALLGIGCVAMLNGQLASGGAMIVASILGGRVLAPLVQLIGAWQMVVNARSAWMRIDSLLERYPDEKAAMQLPPARGKLTVDAANVFAPGSGAQLLRSIAFSLNPGESLAIVGPSASGKTTLARILVGLWPTMGGKVRLDGVDVYTWSKKELGPQIGYVPQGVELFDGTIAENVARFGSLDMRKVEAACRATGVHDMILEMPQGYETPIGSEGAVLSGGQRQRIALARAIYGDPVFVVLDEPNASLDEAGDSALAQVILDLKARGTTVVMNTHRTSILGVADKMLVLRDGHMHAFGPRDEVLNKLNTPSARQGSAAQRPTTPLKQLAGQGQ
jgi:ATP-binding cassette, subfamily C, bacterial exporter for protease/lipase